MKLIFAIAAAAATMAASPALAGAAYGPPEPKPFVYPDRFTVEAHETAEQAQAKVTAKRNCARNWTIAGIVAGTAADVATTQWNQRDGYRETNPLYGKRATIGEQLAFHAVSGAFTYWRIGRLARHNPAAACRAAKVTAGVALLPGVLNVGVRIVM